MQKNATASNSNEALKHTEELIREYGDFAFRKTDTRTIGTALGDYKKAKDSLKQAIKVAPFMPELYLQLRIIFAKQRLRFVLQQVIYYLRTVETIHLNHIFTFIIVMTHYQKMKKTAIERRLKII